MLCPIIDKAQESFKLVLIIPIFHTFSVNSQTTFVSADITLYIVTLYVTNV